MMRQRPVVALIAWVMAMGALSAPAAARAETIIIHAGHLIAEPGRPQTSDQSIVIENGRIVSIRDGFVAGDRVVDLRDAWVMPGLIDMHTHVYGVMNLGEPAAPQLAYATIESQAEIVLSILPRVNSLLMRGFTTIRSMGDQSSTTYALRDAIDAGSVIGPRMLVAEAQIAVDGGDLDASQFHVRPALEPDLANRGNCTGVVECTRVVRSEIRRGADFIKFRQSGMGGLDPSTGMVESPEEIRAVIETAHQLNRRVAVHVNGSPTFLRAAIEAGADTIEHGPLNDEAISLMRRRGTYYVPTLVAGRLIHYRFEEGVEYLGRAYRAGVPIAFGTDLGIVRQEQMHEEFEVYARAGLPPAEVLRTATVNAAAALGRADLGRIAPGLIADIIAVRADPLQDVSGMATPENVSFVMKDGVVFKNEANAN